MTWFANHIFAMPAKDVIHILASDPILSKRIYWVRDLSQYEWFDLNSRHDWPLNGLLVIRPVGDPAGHYKFWYESKQSLASWFAFTKTSQVDLEILPARVHQDNQDFNIHDYPPIPFLKWLKSLSITTKTPTAYYHCTMWAGYVEIEYAWVFTPNEIAYSYTSWDENTVRLLEYHPNKPKVVKSGDVLVETMKHFGLNLPTPYFALHTRNFPWHKHRYNVNG